MQQQKPRVKGLTLLDSSVLSYLHYTAHQKQAVKDYLLDKSPIPKHFFEFDEHTLEILSGEDDVDQLLEEARNHPRALTGRKIQELAVIKAYRYLLEKNDGKNFMQAVEALYGRPNESIFWGLLQNSLAYARSRKRHDQILAEVEKLININHPSIVAPANLNVEPGLFKLTQKLFDKHYEKELAKLKSIVSNRPAVHRYRDSEVINLFETLLQMYGLDKKGWTVVTDRRADRALVKYGKKQIRIAPGSFRLSRARAIGMALHEVSVHAEARKFINTNSHLLGERRIVEEGLGTFIEQMALKRFRSVRTMRYLGLGLALGLDGKPRNAKEVYEIVWRLRYLGGVAYNKEVAKEYAAKEVTRIFRGMPLSQRGIVITKDLAYVEGNHLVWSYIKLHGPEIVFEKLLGKK